jgi:outer membrane immunogenic protein
MKKLLVASIAAAAFLSAPALAADMPVKGPVYKATPSAPVFSWTGCYLGGNVGGGWGRDGYDFAGSPFGRYNPDGFVGGGQIGCDYQSGSWVVGVRGLFDWSDLKGRGPDLLGAPGFVEQGKITSFDTATARIGVLLQPNTLLYIDGGFASAKFKRTEFNPAGAIFFTSDSRHSGGTIGGGLEWLVGSNWSAFLEYDYLHFGKKHLTTSNGTPIDTIDPHINVVMVGLNYRFSTGKGPVVAKY